MTADRLANQAKVRESEKYEGWEAQVTHAGMDISAVGATVDEARESLREFLRRVVREN